MIPRIMIIKKAFIRKLATPLPVFEYEASVFMIHANNNIEIIVATEYIRTDLSKNFCRLPRPLFESSKFNTKKINPKIKIKTINMIIKPIFIFNLVPNNSLYEFIAYLPIFEL
jgi:hypothetical protein